MSAYLYRTASDHRRLDIQDCLFQMPRPLRANRSGRRKCKAFLAVLFLYKRQLTVVSEG